MHASAYPTYPVRQKGMNDGPEGDPGKGMGCLLLLMNLDTKRVANISLWHFRTFRYSLATRLGGWSHPLNPFASLSPWCVQVGPRRHLALGMDAALANSRSDFFSYSDCYFASVRVWFWRFVHHSRLKGGGEIVLRRKPRKPADRPRSVWWLLVKFPSIHFFLVCATLVHSFLNNLSTHRPNTT